MMGMLYGGIGVLLLSFVLLTVMVLFVTVKVVKLIDKLSDKLDKKQL